jgi:NAD(P)-dependent dehydrogenase (short-subunit alcohol dehydrogenase family)
MFHAKYYQDKVVLITGATSGIGRAVGEMLCAYGAHVVFTGRRIERAEKIVAEAVRGGGSAEALRLDVTDADAVLRAIEKVCQRWGRLDILFNNAGISIGGEVLDLQLEHWQEVIDVNLRGVLHGIRAAYPVMVKQKSGQIVNVSSLVGLIGYPVNTPYAATKAAVVMLSHCLRLEAEAYGVKVNVVCPGYVETEIFQVSRIINADKDRIRSRRPFKPISAEAAARVILAGVAKDKGTIVFPAYARILWWLYSLSPRLVIPLGRKVVNVFRAAKPPPDTETPAAESDP